jgi:hypothetical protein
MCNPFPRFCFFGSIFIYLVFKLFAGADIGAFNEIILDKGGKRQAPSGNSLNKLKPV